MITFIFQYLLDKGKGHQNAHSFEDYFPFEKIRRRINVISMAEFFSREGITGHLTAYNDSSLVLYPPGNKVEFDATKRVEKRAMFGYLRRVGYCPKWEPFNEFLVFPPKPGDNVSHFSDSKKYLDALRIFSNKEKKQKRTPVYYDEFLQSVPLLHFVSQPEDGYRLLSHW